MRKHAFAVTAAVALSVAATASGAARPAAPTIAGPTATVPGAHTYVLSSVEKGVPQSRLRFRCSLDSTTLHACRSRVTLTLAGGDHLLRAQATDPAGRRSAVTRLRIAVQGIAPELAPKTIWQQAVTTTKIGGGGTGTGAQFGLAVGPDGNAYVTNVADDRVQVYDPAGNLLRTWGSRGTGPGQFRFEDNPDPADKAIPFSGIAVDHATGTVYVEEPLRVQKFDAQGTYELGWGKPGIDNGQFGRIADIAVGPNGTIYTLEDRPTSLGRVQEFDPSGKFLTTFGRGQIEDSGGIVLDAQGDVLVADDFADNVKVFGADGKLLRTFGQAGSTPGQLDFPTDLALDGNTLYVADQDHLRVVRFDLATGKPTGYWLVAGTPVGLATDAAGGVYMIDDSGLLTRYALP
jgi:DNA-binding beta-propeller fold protein YncE